MAKSNSRGGRNNNPSGRNQYSDWGVMEMARERPLAAAATAVGAAAAGLFLWSRRTQISDQLSDLSDRFGEWTENMRSGSGSEFESAGADGGTMRSGAGSASASGSGTSRSTSRRSGMSETGGGNASLGAHSGGGGSTGSAGGRGQAKSQPTT